MIQLKLPNRLLVLLLLSWTTICVVCPNYEVVVFQLQTGITPYLGSITIFTTVLYSSHPTCFNRFWMTPIAPPSSICWRRFDLLLHPLLPPPTFLGAEWPSTWTTPPPADLHLSSALPSLAGRPQGVSRAIQCMPSLVRFPPLCHPWPTPKSLSAPGVLPFEGPFLYLPASVILTSAPPPAGLDWQPSPLPVPKSLRRVILSYVPCLSSSSSLCSAPSLGVFCSLISLRVYFCAR